MTVIQLCLIPISIQLKSNDLVVYSGLESNKLYKTNFRLCMANFCQFSYNSFRCFPLIIDKINGAFLL